MKRFTLLPVVALFLCVGSFGLTGCATDVVGKAEQTTHIAAINLDTFVTFEKANHDQLLAINPAIYQLAQKIRHKECPTCDRNGVRWLKSARVFTEAYRLNRSADNMFQLQTALALLQTTLDQITQYFLDPQVAGLNPQMAALAKKK